MSYYTGLSLREIYTKRCEELQCKPNSSICALLSDVPDEFHSLTFLDLSKNFVGPRGILPVLDIVECCQRLRTLDFRDQQLSREAVEVICARLRCHPSVLRLNLSCNPVTLSGGAALLDLAKVNHIIQYITLEHTMVRPSMVIKIELQLEKNRAAASLTDKEDASTHRSVGAMRVTNTSFSKARSEGSSETLRPEELNRESLRRDLFAAAESGVSAALSDPMAAVISAASLSTAAQPHRSPSYEVYNVLKSFAATLCDRLFDADPTEALTSLCDENHYFFDDPQFSSSDRVLHQISHHMYEIASWRRVSELFPDATLYSPAPVMPSIQDGTLQQRPLRLPSTVAKGFSWIFCSLGACFSSEESLSRLIFTTGGSGPHGGGRLNSAGVYTVRFFMDGQWRFIVLDDFLPVNRKGELIFTKPTNNAVWPCLLEKAVAKLHGGYHLLDLLYEEHHVGIDSPNIRKPIIWKHLAGSAAPKAAPSNPMTALYNAPEDPLTASSDAGNCGRLMADFTGCVYTRVALHPHEAFASDVWWEEVVQLPFEALGRGNRPSYGSLIPSVVAVSREAAKLPSSGIAPRSAYQLLQVCQVSGFRLLELDNHWCGRHRWNGDWADDSQLWKKFPEVDEELRGGGMARKISSVLPPMRREHSSASSARTTSSFCRGPSDTLFMNQRRSRKTAFWMSYVDFQRFFETVHVCKQFSDDFHRADIFGEWSRTSAGGSARSSSWYVNPHYRLSLPYRTTFHFHLSRRDRRFTKAERPQSGDCGLGIGFQILRDDLYPLFCTETASSAAGADKALLPFSSTIYSNIDPKEDSVVAVLTLEPGDKYWLVPSTFEPWVLDTFFLKVFASSGFVVRPEAMETFWDFRRLPVESVLSAPPQTTKQDCGQFAISLKQRERVCSNWQPGWMNRGYRAKSGLPLRSAGGTQLPCRVIIAAIMPEDVKADIEQRENVVSERDGGLPAAISLMLIPGEHDHDGKPSRSVRPLGNQTSYYTGKVDRCTILEAELPANGAGDISYFTGIFSADGAAPRVEVACTVWSSSPLVDAVLLPSWEKHEFMVQWDTKLGSGTIYEAAGNPQVEIRCRHPYQRFFVAMRLDSSDTVGPAIMFSAIDNDGNAGEMAKGKLVTQRLLVRSDYVPHSLVSADFSVGVDCPDSIILLPSLQPAGSHGKCFITISSDINDFESAVLHGAVPCS